MQKTHALSDYLYACANSEKDILLMHQMKEQDQRPEATDYSKPRFTLVVGPSPFTMPRGWEFFLTSPYEGATYISTVVHNAGYPVNIVDVRYALDPLKECFDSIMRGTDVLGICTFEDNFPFVQKLIEMVKEKIPNVPIICGGSLVTSIPRIFMEYTKADIAVISEGELTILELMDSYSRDGWNTDFARINGIYYRGKNKEICKTLPRGQMKNLDFLPRMKLDLWPQYRSEKGLQPQIIASYSRGCKMDCSFCYRTTPQIAAKSPEKFNEDLAWLKNNYGIEFVMFSDLTFSSLSKQTIEMCNVIRDHNIKWSCLTRCYDVDKERLDSMKRAGCDLILYGVESLNADALKIAHKGNSKNITMNAMNLTYDAGIRFGALLIVGLPGEKEDTLEVTSAWAEEMNHVTRVKYLSLLPGTPFYSEYVEKGVIKSELDHIKWLSIEQALYNDEFINVSGLDESIVRKAYKRIYDSYQPGPVMNFAHFPDHFSYTYPNMYDGKMHSVQYAGDGWRKDFSSAGPHLTPGSEKYTFQAMGLHDLAKTGASLVESGAKIMGKTRVNVK